MKSQFAVLSAISLLVIASDRAAAAGRCEENWNWKAFNADRDLQRAKEESRDLDVTQADLSAFTRRGGKIIFYHGWADPSVAPQGTINYFERLQAETQGAADAFRLFMVPSMGHCSGGEGVTDRFDMVKALNEWVANGTAPMSIVASAQENGRITRTRQLCPYPQVARYKGSGDSDLAVSFTCAAP